MNAYTITIGTETRVLPIIQVSPELSIASFVMLGDTALIEAAARELTIHPAFPRDKLDMLVCPEAKAIPLTHAMARILGLNYIVARKSIKSYMKNVVMETVTSITTTEKQKLVLDGTDIAQLEGKNVCIIDDVVSTGESVNAMENLLKKTNCRVIAKAAVLLEDAGYAKNDIIYLEKLPVFRNH